MYDALPPSVGLPVPVPADPGVNHPAIRQPPILKQSYYVYTVRAGGTEFLLTPPLLYVNEGTIFVNHSTLKAPLPPMVRYALFSLWTRIGETIHKIVTNQITHYKLQDRIRPTDGSPSFDIFKRPEDFIYQSADITTVMVSVLWWHECSAFVCMQGSKGGCSVVVYFADLVLRDVGIGIPCTETFDDMHEFTETIRRIVKHACKEFGNSSDRRLSELIHKFQSAGEANIRFGV